MKAPPAAGASGITASDLVHLPHVVILHDRHTGTEVVHYERAPGLALPGERAHEEAVEFATSGLYKTVTVAVRIRRISHGT